MMRLLGLLLLCGIVAAAAFVYDVKHQTNHLGRRASELARQIERERDTIATLRAEWSALNQPARLQALSERHLRHLRPFVVAQIGLPHEVPDRPIDLGQFIDTLASRGQMPAFGPDAGSPTGATRNPIPLPLPVPRPQPPRR